MFSRFSGFLGSRVARSLLLAGALHGPISSRRAGEEGPGISSKATGLGFRFRVLGLRV